LDTPWTNVVLKEFSDMSAEYVEANDRGMISILKHYWYNSAFASASLAAITRSGPSTGGMRGARLSRMLVPQK